nr:hypothetical protein Iba_chr02eCG10550 [Ipomoea batatas]
MQVILSALPRVNAVSVSFLAAASGFSSLCEIETASYSSVHLSEKSSEREEISRNQEPLEGHYLIWLSNNKLLQHSVTKGTGHCQDTSNPPSA